MEMLPEDCLAHILSLASPQDACRCSVISSSMRFMADSDTIWEKFLPPNYEEILSRFVTPLGWSSRKDLFFRLCEPRLIDGGKKMFSIEKKTGKQCYMLSSRELSITWGSSPLYWAWKPVPDSRFEEAAVLRTICWLEINGRINTRMLASNTTYGAYLVVRFAERAYGLDSVPSEVSIQVGNFKSKASVYLRNQESSKGKAMDHGAETSRRRRVLKEKDSGLRERQDGWVEIDLGRFYNKGRRDEEVVMCLKEVRGVHLKGGLIVEGIEIRPNE